MKVIIRNETYEVHDPAMVKVDGRGVTDAERAASAVRAALRQGHKHLDLNKRGLECNMPKMVRCASDWDA